MGLHKNITLTDIHTIVAFSYANQSAREGATGLSSADIHKVAYQEDNSTYWVLTNHSPVTWTQINAEAATVFGTQFTYGESLDESGTTGDTWIQKVRISPTSLPSGNYIIWFSLMAYASNNATIVGTRLERDDTVVICATATKPGDTETEVPCMQHAVLVGVSGSHTYDLEFRNQNTVGTAYIRQARLTFWRIS